MARVDMLGTGGSCLLLRSLDDPTVPTTVETAHVSMPQPTPFTNPFGPCDFAPTHGWASSSSVPESFRQREFGQAMIILVISFP